ncbi:hypothetical protein BJ875DRAFT_479592 [Amylocarpus encephaloides]|uniref:Uncharacterized protein n=1 Tax=Amylocarpus encephaloides TaxID=45428 RepID=A0A9P8CBK0_9HELO|nr:hypothetical protein BJ875DRAFT_479592 [Amylocarpus encephaloides]
MPPKCKALSQTTGNFHKAKITKQDAKATPTGAKSLTFKYCNASTCYRVSDLGIPLSYSGETLTEKLSKEANKRNQDLKDLYIYEYWNGWGVSEVVENLLKDFDRDVYKKTVSPWKKWAYVEAFACFIKSEDLYMMYWMDNESGLGVKGIINMTGVMALTCLDVLLEHDLLKPDSEVKNIPIICLMMIELLEGVAADFDCGWSCELVRLCDEKGIELEMHVRKQVSVSEEKVKSLREFYREKKEYSDYDQGEDGEDSGYKAFARKEDWKPEDDVVNDERLWYRWDWQQEYKGFKKNHTGGNHYGLTKRTKSQLEKHAL